MPEKEIMPVQIQDATPDDYDGIRQVQELSWLATYPNAELGITKEDIAARFQVHSEEARRRRQAAQQRINTDPLVHLWVARQAQRIVGFCIAAREETQNRIQAIYVLPECQGTGVGRRLLQTALDWLGGLQAVVLNVASYNQSAIAFYRRFDFIPSDRPAHSGVTRLPSGAVIPEMEMIRK